VKTITCPAHPSGRVHPWSLTSHKAVLFEHGEQYAGQWECLRTGEEDVHEHSDYEIETVEVDDSHPDRSDGYSYQVYVCGGPEGCGVTIDADVADPDVDRAEALADMQIMEALRQMKVHASAISSQPGSRWRWTIRNMGQLILKASSGSYHSMPDATVCLRCFDGQVLDPTQRSEMSEPQTSITSS
jgi:hypothetical protein